MPHDSQRLEEEALLATLIYYDCFNWPLTAFEIWQRLIQPLKDRINKPATDDQRQKFSLHDVVYQLEYSPYLKKYIAQKNGFYFLKGRDTLVEDRIEATKVNEEKLKRLWHYRWVFLGTAFIEGVFVSGSVAGGWAREESDIDVLVVARKGRIWTARLFLTLLTSLLGIRRKGGRIKDAICLNHYISSDALTVPFKSLYNAQSYIQLVPFINYHGIFERFSKENRWIRNYFLATSPSPFESRFIYNFPTSFILETFMVLDKRIDEVLLSGMIGDGVEFLAKRLQLFYIKRNPLTEREGGRITAEDWQLEFHPLSKEKQILECYNKKIKALGLKEFYPEKDSGLTKREH